MSYSEFIIKKCIGRRRAIKRTFDILLSLVLLVLLFPLLILISIIIKIDSSGPFLFKQERIGQYGKKFLIYKFRTMIPNAENQGTGVFTNDQDPRITKFGSFLRKTSLDELPQIFNVLNGTMSFVGPRPPVTYHPREYKDYSEIQKIRFIVKPGITGLAQVSGRNSLSWDEKIEIDIEYVQEMSFILDIKIILKTVFLVFKREGVYRKEK